MKVLVLLGLVLLLGGGRQTNYCEGFEDGYRRGWCYMSCQMDVCTLYVNVPVCPVIRCGESPGNYQDGYDHGFSKALYERQFLKRM